MKKLSTLIFIFMMTLSNVYSQSEKVELRNNVYDFLNRLYVKGVIDNYSNASLPLSRAKVTEYLKFLDANIEKLNNTEIMKLSDLKKEFQYELNISDSSGLELFKNGSFFNNLSNLFSDRERYIYSFADSNNTFFLNAMADAKFIASKGDILNNKNVTLIQWGGKARGTINRNFGYYLLATNGQRIGEKELVFSDPSMRNNYKLNELDQRNFDFTEGYVCYDGGSFSFQLGRERITIGSGYNEKMLVSSVNAMDFIKMEFEIGAVNYTFLHNWILTKPTKLEYNEFEVDGRIVDSKYLALHRLGISLCKNNIEIGLSEMIVYSNRPPEIAYMTPLIFYKSVEHSLQDRDNALLAFDGSARITGGLKLYGTLVVDELDFSKIGTNWWGNLFSYQIGGFVTEPFGIENLDVNAEYIKIVPYTYSHKFIENNYTNFNSFIGPNMHPNSDKLYFNFKYAVSYRLAFDLGISYERHGSNLKDGNGNVIKNVGGDINFGHRYEDSEEVTFLDGEVEKKTALSALVNYEIFNNIFFSAAFIHNIASGVRDTKQNMVNFILNINY